MHAEKNWNPDLWSTVSLNHARRNHCCPDLKTKDAPLSLLKNDTNVTHWQMQAEGGLTVSLCVFEVGVDYIKEVLNI